MGIETPLQCLGTAHHVWYQRLPCNVCLYGDVKAEVFEYGEKVAERRPMSHFKTRGDLGKGAWDS